MQRLLLLIPLALGLVTESIHAAHVDYYLKLDGIDGESTNSRHTNEVEISSFHWGMSREGTNSAAGGGGGGAGKVSFQDMHFVAKLSKASPKLFLACATGQHIKKVSFTARHAGGTQQEYYTITLTDVLVTSYQTGGAPATTGDVVPTDQFSVNYAKVEFKHIGLDGTVTSGEATRLTPPQ